MTSQPPIALVKRGPELYITGILPRGGNPGSDLLSVRFIGQGLPHQAHLARLPYGPVGEGDTHELAAQALVEKLQAETIDFPAFLLALANGAEAEADVGDGDALDDESLEQDAVLLRILAGLAAQEHHDEQVDAIFNALENMSYGTIRGLEATFMPSRSVGDVDVARMAEAMFSAGWRFTAPAASTTAAP
jgi:hypothetical protein